MISIIRVMEVPMMMAIRLAILDSILIVFVISAYEVRAIIASIPKIFLSSFSLPFQLVFERCVF